MPSGPLKFSVPSQVMPATYFFIAAGITHTWTALASGCG
jgi:hypothetical protein